MDDALKGVSELVQLFELEKHPSYDAWPDNIKDQVHGHLVHVITTYPDYKEFVEERFSPKDKGEAVRSIVNKLTRIQRTLNSLNEPEEQWFMAYIEAGLGHFSSLHAGKPLNINTEPEKISGQLRRIYPVDVKPSEVLKNTVDDYLVLANHYKKTNCKKKAGARDDSKKEHKKYLVENLAKIWKGFAYKPGKPRMSGGTTPSRFSKYINQAFKMVGEKPPERKTINNYISDQFPEGAV